MLTELMKLSAPITITLLGQILMGAVDLGFVGRIDEYSMAAVSLGSNLFNIPFLFAVGVFSALDYFVSRHSSDEDPSERMSYLKLSTLASLFFGITSAFLFGLSPKLLPYFGYEKELIERSWEYIPILSFSLIPSLLHHAFKQTLQATEKAYLPLQSVIVGNVLNALLNYALIFGHFGFEGLGVKGAAIATFVSRAVMAFYLYLGLKDAFRFGTWWDKEKVKQYFKVGLPSGFQVFLEIGVFVATGLIASRLSAIEGAAHQLALRLASITFMFPLGISISASIFISRYQSKGDAAGLRQAGMSAYKAAIVLMLCFAVMFGGFPEFFVHLFTQKKEVVEIAIPLIKIAAIWQICDGIQVVGAGVLRGLGNTRTAFLGNFVGHWIVGFPIGLLLCYGYSLRVMGLWIGLLIGLGFVGAILFYYWQKLSRTQQLA